MLDGMEECFGPNRVGDRFTNPRARIIPAPKSIDHSHKRRIVPLHLNPGMSPGFLFESFPANTHGGQQMPSKLYVGNLAYSVTNDDLQALFSQLGKVASAAVVSDKFSGQSRGFGFVEMESSGDATSRSTGPSPENLAAVAAGGTTVVAVAAAPTAGRSGVGSARARPFRFHSEESGQWALIAGRSSPDSTACAYRDGQKTGPIIWASQKDDVGKAPQRTNSQTKATGKATASRQTCCRTAAAS